MTDLVPTVFRCFIHPRPRHVFAGPTVDWCHRRLATLDGTRLPTQLFRRSYDEVAAHLREISGLYLEPDGSFAWRGGDSTHEIWRLEGQLTDGGRALATLELVGHCQAPQLDQLLHAVGWPEMSVVFQLRDAGIFVDEITFRTHILTEPEAAPDR